MMQEIDENEFYHEDFTTASDWEILIAHLEEIINQWRNDHIKNEPDLENKKWQIRTEKFVYIDANLNLCYYKRLLNDTLKPKHVMDKWYDFKGNKLTEEDIKDNCLAEWYGLDEFIVLSSAAEKVDVINNESKAKILLSALTIVVNNLVLEIPFFLQVLENWQKVYYGIYSANGIRTNFDIVHLKKAPNNAKHLNGLLEIFKSKINSPCSIEEIFISYKATYCLEDFGNFIWKQDYSTESLDVENLFILPFGATTDTIKTIELNAIWSYLSEHSVIDTANYSDFNPLKSQKWLCKVEFTESPICLLGDCLAELFQFITKQSTIYDYLGDYAVQIAPPENNPLDLLTDTRVPTISSLLTRVSRSSFSRNKSSPPLNETTLVPLLYFLFPDADENSSFSYEETADVLLKKIKIYPDLMEEFKGFKTCSENSLVWRLSVVLVHAVQSLGGPKAFCHIWYEFVQEMRYRWENSTLIPGITPGMPDLRTSLLNQKLQMLNCCIQRKLNRKDTEQKFASAENSDDDDDFFDAAEESDEDGTHKEQKYSLWDRPVGRMSKFGDLKLLKTGDPLYIPLTQDSVLKTEDQLEEDADVLLKLGSDNEASELRARIMSASLFSDMESFKAANPGAILEDFIRWYSPRDWLEIDEIDEYGQKKGILSPRMQLADNIWVEMWENSRPIPANRQKRLFDDTREAEKAIQFLDLRTIRQIIELIIPTVAHAAIYRILEELESLPFEIADGKTKVSNLIKHAENLSRDSKLQPKRLDIFILEINNLELQISQVNSLEYKLNPQEVSDDEDIVINNNNLISDLIEGKTIEIVGKDKSLIGGRLLHMFYESNNKEFSNNEMNFPAAFQREFVLRTNCIRPNLCSTKSPQFLRAILNKNEFRLVGAFSEDITFF